MIDLKFLRENPEEVKRAIKLKKVDLNVDELLAADSAYMTTLQNVETHRALRNRLSDDIGKVDKEERAKLIEEATNVKEELKKMEEELNSLEEKRSELAKKVPNLIANDVPEGADEEENVVVREWGTPQKFDFDPKDHIELGESLGIIDTERSSKVVGSRFNYLYGDAALLQFALIQFTMETLTDEKIISKLAKSVNNPSSKPFIPVVPPVMVRQDVMDKMDRLEPRDERYLLDQDELVLVGSAEHTMGPMHMDETLKDEELPRRYIGYSTAFRREAGSYGKDTRGIIRVHQFDKLEMESFTRPEDGLAEQDLLVAVQEYLVQQLEIPHQVMMVCTGDMGKPDFRQIDINSWMPGQGKYRETHTSDYMTDFQSRRLNIRCASGEYVHMNDATAIAIGRMLVAILENNQNADGTVDVPKVLQKYVGKKVIK